MDKASRRSLKASPAYAAIPDLQRPSPAGYSRFSELAIHLAATHYMLRGTTGSLAAACAGSAFAANSNAPLIHLTPELGQAFLATAAPTFLDELRMPYPAYLLNLPEGLLFSDGGEAVLAVVVADPRAAAAWVLGPWADAVRRIDPSYGAFTNRVMVPARDADLIVTALLSSGELEYLHVSLSLAIQAANRGLPAGEIGASEPLVGESQITSELARLALNSILLLQARPELLTEELASVLPRRGFGGAPYKGSIRWLGKGYRRAVSSSGGTGNCTGKAPHWRRGHWHQVPCGAGRADRRLRWFEPVYVNGGVAQAA